ncbi:hypothetical protein B4110_2207 [Parageobacillus toebii]|uniref:Uncharacterized protein n=1 Tax=Parageobacillus toebii TaxID=153151 RepID=A0A150N1F8_9BACL|nr:hypothetical protein B4110_2207 [Parageobacillus toebii]
MDRAEAHGTKQEKDGQYPIPFVFISPIHIVASVTAALIFPKRK